jgi:hypothetical protein
MLEWSRLNEFATGAGSLFTHFLNRSFTMQVNFKSLLIVPFIFLMVGCIVIVLFSDDQKISAREELGTISWNTMATVFGGAEGSGCNLGTENTTCTGESTLFFCSGCVGGLEHYLDENLENFTEKSGNTGYFPSSDGNNNAAPNYSSTVDCDRLSACLVSNVDNDKNCPGGLHVPMACYSPAYGSPATGCATASQSGDGYWQQAGYGTCVDP